MSGFQRDETVRKSDRDQRLTPVLRGELDRDMPAEGRRRSANVEGDVEDAAANDPHQFGLREGRRLEVQPRKVLLAVQTWRLVSFP
jgi:hypothetical protein